jgi:hypothetical protein
MISGKKPSIKKITHKIRRNKNKANKNPKIFKVEAALQATLLEKDI